MRRLALALAAVIAGASLATFSAEEPELNLVLENHRFTPDRLEIPAGKKVKVMIDNRDPTAEEFDSGDLRVEKVVPGKSKGVVWLGPLKPGEYKFMGEYNDKTAQGVVVAK